MHQTRLAVTTCHRPSSRIKPASTCLEPRDQQPRGRLRLGSLSTTAVTSIGLPLNQCFGQRRRVPWGAPGAIGTLGASAGDQASSRCLVRTPGMANRREHGTEARSLFLRQISECTTRVKQNQPCTAIFDPCCSVRIDPGRFTLGSKGSCLADTQHRIIVHYRAF